MLAFFPAVLLAQMEKVGELWRWVQFTAEVGLPSNRVLDVVETRSGMIWANTQSGLARFDGYCWVPVGAKEGLPQIRANAIAECSPSEILVLAEGRLYRGGSIGFRERVVSYHGRRTIVRSMANLPDLRVLAVSDSVLYELEDDSLRIFPVSPELLHQKILRVFVTKDGSTWVNTTRGLYRNDGKNWALVLAVSRSPLIIWYLASSKNRRALAYLDSPLDMRGVWEFDPGRPPRRVYDQRPGVIYSIDVDSCGNAVAVFETGRISCRHGDVWEDLSHRPNRMKDVSFIRFRTNGDFWMGTESALYIFLASSLRWSYWASGEQDERMSTNVIARTNDGTIWVGHGMGIELHRSDGTSGVIDEINGERISIVTGIAQDRDGDVWISSGGGFEGAYRWNGTQWRHFGLKDGLAARYIHRIAIDRKGRPWFLGLTGYETKSHDQMGGPGAFVYDQGRFTRWGKDEGLLPGRVYAFEEGNNGEYWFGTSNGLSRWNKGQWTHWTRYDALKIDRVFTLAVDHQNRVWFGDQYNGLGVVTNDSVRYYTTADGLVGDAVWEVKLDARDRLWIATRSGLGSFDNGEWCTFGPGTGLSHTSLWPLLPVGNKVYVGTNGGGTAILNLQGESLHAPRVEFSEPAVEAGAVLLRWQAFSYYGEIGHRDVETRYRLDDQPYSAWGRDREVTFFSRSSGTHTFRIQTKGLFGVHDSAGQALSFDVPPPVYRQPVFFLPVAILSLGVIALVISQARRKRRFDAALRRSEALYRSVVEDQSELIMRFLPDGTRSFVNGAYCRYFGVSASEVIGTNFFSSLSDEHKQRVRSKLSSLTPGSPVATDEHCSVGSGGETRWHQWTDRAVFDERGRVVEFQGVGQDVTERKQVESALRESEELYRKLVDASPDAISVIDLSGSLTFSSQRALGLFGETTHQVIGRNIIEWVAPEEREKAAANLGLLLETGEIRDTEYVLLRRGGVRFAAEINAAAIRTSDGSPKGIILVTRDVTERKRSEESMRILAHTMQGISEIATITDLEDRITFVNDAFVRTYGYQRSEVIGSHIGILWSSNNPPMLLDEILTRNRTGGWKGEILNLTKEGREFPLFLRTSQVKDDKGNVIGLAGISEDITERKRAEQALRKWAHIFEYAQWGVATSSPDQHCFELINPEFARMHGYTVDELVGTPILDVYPPECRSQFLEEVVVAHAKGHHAFESKHMRKDGTVFPVLVDMTVIKDNNGSALYRAVNVQDISERKRTKDALRESTERQALLLRSIPMAFYTASPRGRMETTWVSDQVENIAGFSTQQFMEDTMFWTNRLHPDDRDRAAREYKSILEKGSIINEYRWLCGDGTYRWFLDLSVLTGNGQGGPGEIIGAWLDITDRKKVEQELRDSRSRLTKLNECLLSFGPDPDENVNRLVALCGEQLGGTAALYNRLEGEDLFSLGRWNTPVDYTPRDKGEGHICFDVIQKRQGEARVIRNLRETAYATTDPNVLRYGLETYVGKAVSFADTCAGSLCVVFNRDHSPSEEDLNLMGIAAAAIGVEEKRKRAEEELRRSEHQYRLLFMENPHTMYVHDLETFEFLAVNDAAVSHYGYSRDEFLSMTIKDIRPEEDIAPLVKNIRETSEAPVYFGAWRHRKKDGSLIAVEISAHTTQFAGKRARIILAMDVTARRQAEEQVAMLGHTIRSISEAVSITDLNNRLLFVNSAFLDLYGYTESELIGNSIEIVRSPLDRTTHVTAILEDTQKGGWHGELVNRKKDGADFPVSLSTSVVYDDKDRAIALVGVAQDITDRKQAEEALQERERQLEEAQHIGHIGSWEWDVAANIASCSDELYAIFGRDPSSFTFTLETFLSTPHPDDRRMVEEEIRRMFSTLQPCDFDYRVVTASGDIRWVHSRGAVVARNGIPVNLYGTAQDITDRKKAQEALREGEERLRLAITGARMYTWDWNIPSGRLVRSGLHQEVLESDPSVSESTYEQFLSTIHPDDREGVERSVERALQGTDPYQASFRVIRPNGDVQWLETRGQAYRDDSGKTVRMIGVTQDITGRKRSEEEVRMLKHSIDVHYDGAYWHDINNRLIYVNEAGCRALGYDRQELIGKTLDEVNSMATTEVLARVWDKLRTEGFFSSESVHRRKDGSEFPVDIITTYVQFGGREYACGFAHDITERKLAEKAMRERNRFIENILENSPIGFAVNTISDGHAQFINSKFEEIYGVPRGSLKDIESFFHEVYRDPDFREQMRSRIMADIESGDPARMIWEDIPVRTANGEKKYVTATGIPLLEQGLMVSTAQDVTARKHAEEQIRASLREKETLLKEIHHRVKNNLQVISSLLNLQSHYIKDEHSKALFREAQNRVKSMALIHEKLYQSEELANIDFGSYVKNLTAYLFRSYVVDPNLVALTVDVQETRLNIDKAIPCGLIINELVSNSLKYAFPHGARGEITVRLFNGDNTVVVLAVSDNGVGLPDDLNLRTADSLGLQLVSSLADQLAATVEVKRGEGTEYRLSFPQ